MTLSRRTFLTSSAAVVATAVTGVGAAGAAQARTAQAPGPTLLPKGEAFYRSRVPELFNASFQEPKALASHTQVLVIGTGFSAAATALRLGQAGLRVAMLERGLRYPQRPRYRTTLEKVLQQGDTFSPEQFLEGSDGRALWFRTNQPKGIHGLPIFTGDYFAGVLEMVDHPGIQVWRPSVVGGGSIVYNGVLIAPEQRFFDHVWQGAVNYQEMSSTWYPKALAGLHGSTMPDDLYQGRYGTLGSRMTDPFGHCRVWDRLFTKGGYTTEKTNSNFAWNVVRDELDGKSRPSSIVGETNFGNSNGAKFDLTQGYLRDAEATGKVTIHPRHVVTAVGQQADGKYWVRFDLITPFGEISQRNVTVTCDRLVLGAGSMGTTELLLRARHDGTLKNLNEHVGEGWGTNGDAAVILRNAESSGLAQGTPSPSRILDEKGTMPVTYENWSIPGIGANPSLIGLGLIGSLSMTLDDTRASFGYNPGSDTTATRARLRLDGKPDGGVTLGWPTTGNDQSVAAQRAVINRVAAATSGVKTGVPGLVPDVNAGFTAHPLGGAVLGKATDGYGRVPGHPGLYVVDASLIPGSTGPVNPVLTITALAERNVAKVIADGK